MFDLKSSAKDEQIGNLPISNNIVILNDDAVNDEICQVTTDDPVVVVSDLLSELIKNCGAIEINEESLAELAESSDVQNVLSKTCNLKYVDVSLLQTYDQTKCFLTNLANLLWIHASIRLGISSGLYDKSWQIRQVHNNLIGYNIGALGFVSLYELHNALLNYPDSLKLNTLSTLPMATEIDSRLVFVLSVPDICTPKIKVLSVEHLDYELEQMYREYLQTYVIYLDESLLIPLVVLWYLENELQIQQNTNMVVDISTVERDKLNLLAELLNKCGLPYLEVTDRDAYFVSELKVCIKCTYTGREKDQAMVCHRVLWNQCLIHDYTLSQCLHQHMMLLKSLLFVDDDLHATKYCSCSKSSQFCLNYLLLASHSTFVAVKSKYTLITEPNERVRCLRSLVSLLNGSSIDDEDDVNMPIEIRTEDFNHLITIISSRLTVVPTELLCQKIHICRKISSKTNKLDYKWPLWFDLFGADVNDVLDSMIEFDYFDFAGMWFTLHTRLDGSFRFRLETQSDYISLLCAKNSADLIDDVVKLLSTQEMDQILNDLIQRNYPAANMVNLVTSILKSKVLLSSHQVKFKVLRTGLNMVSCIPLLEQPLYMAIVYRPVLIIEQMLLAGRFSLLQSVIKETTRHIEMLPESVQESESISKSQIDQLLRIYASKALLLVNARPNSALEQVADNESVISRCSFIPPEKPPEMTNWVANNEADCCMCCQETVFTMLSRRHHCRRCGRLVCYYCSKQRQKIDGYKTPVRVCDDCFTFETSERDSQSDVSSCSSLTTACNNGEIKWRLSLDENNNNAIRQQFVYENAPSVSACLSILDLHSKHICIPRFLYNRCESLTRILRLRNSIEADNLDYVQISVIIKSLLLAAKIYYTYLNVSSGVQQCEELENEVELLDRLSQINITSLVPGKPLRGATELRRIRHLILEQQQWNLALEISTKAGLDCASVWFAWGRACLKDRNLEAAREKFSRSSLEKNQRLLNDILQMLHEIYEDNKTSESSSPAKGNTKKAQEECNYYLRTYGSTTQLLDYYVKHNELKTALEYSRQENVSPEVFLEKIYVPCLKNSSTQTLHQLMEDIDKSLISWKDYLRIACMFCERNNYLEVLYNIQLWIKDYVRAAMTSIMFYLHDAHSYSELTGRDEHLHNALSHFEAALKPTTTKKNDLIMVLSSSEIEKHVNTIWLQIGDVSRTIVSNHQSASMKFSSVPTLFGDSYEKTYVIVLIFGSETNARHAFTIAHRLVTEYSLNSISVYSKVLKHLIEIAREGDAISLLNCITERLSNSEKVKDKIISNTLTKVKPKEVTETMISFVTDNSVKISLYIECGLLKSAYLLAVKHNELDFIKKIAEEADKLRMFSVKRICEQKLNKNKQ